MKLISVLTASACALTLCAWAPAFCSDAAVVPNKADWLKANGPFAQGNRFVQLKQYSEAITKFQEAIAIYPGDPNYHFNLALAYKHKGELTMAVDEFKKSIELGPGSWRAWKGLANTYYKLARFNEARSAFGQALQCNPPAAEIAELKKGLAFSAAN